MSEQALIQTFVRWTGIRAVLHNGWWLVAGGWWLVTSLYWVLDAGLSPAELVFIGAGQPSSRSSARCRPACWRTPSAESGPWSSHTA